MATLVQLLGVLIVLIGLVGLVNPKTLLAWTAWWQESNRMKGAMILRIVLGAFLLRAAEDTRWPTVILVIGAIALASGIIGLFMGKDRLEKLIAWFANQSETALRMWMVGPIAFGALIMLAAM